MLKLLGLGVLVYAAYKAYQRRSDLAALVDRALGR